MIPCKIKETKRNYQRNNTSKHYGTKGPVFSRDGFGAQHKGWRKIHIKAITRI